ncbi:DNA polymerase beta superfamily protein [Bacillus pinisoli]|uniref:nucleotidyltransferase domain-containing protein n=1 Tax=Bacillus pinisoli TaxID=2901866 RepID=UPI00234323EC|nr:nucleotidyltransferase domain-containing protein [Bacillus pinisoli]
MREAILMDLKAMELENGFQIIYACEAGSRIWGTHSHESDFDVRFLYHYSLDKYLELDQPKDTFEQSYHQVEYVGWELGKGLRLLRKQNPSILEWIHSPQIYVNKNNSKEDLAYLHKRFFHIKPLLYHYYKMAEGNYHSLCKGSNHSIKLQLNIIRPILVCQWLLETEQFPPLSIKTLLSCNLQDEIRHKIINMIMNKKQGQLNVNHPDSTLQDWMLEQLNQLSEDIQTIDPSPSYSNRDFTSEMNTLYQSFLMNKYRE